MCTAVGCPRYATALIALPTIHGDSYAKRPQVRSAAAASVLISVHGADLTNMLWMRPGTAAIEVTLRYGWCCDPVPQQHWGNEAPPCEACDSMYGCCRARDYRLQVGRLDRTNGDMAMT